MSQSDFTDAIPFHSEFRARTNEIGICGRLHPGRCHRFFREGGLLIFPRFSAGCFPFSDEGGSIYRDRNPFLLRLQIERLLQSPNLGSGCGVKGIPSAGAMAVSSLNLISRSFRMSHQCRDRFDSIVLLIRFSGSSRSCIFRFSLFPIADYFLCEISFLRFHPQIQKEHSEGLVNYRGCGGGGGMKEIGPAVVGAPSTSAADSPSPVRDIRRRPADASASRQGGKIDGHYSQGRKRKHPATEVFQVNEDPVLQVNTRNMKEGRNSSKDLQILPETSGERRWEGDESGTLGAAVAGGGELHPRVG